MGTPPASSHHLPGTHPGLALRGTTQLPSAHGHAVQARCCLRVSLFLSARNQPFSPDHHMRPRSWTRRATARGDHRSIRRACPRRVRSRPLTAFSVRIMAGRRRARRRGPSASGRARDRPLARGRSGPRGAELAPHRRSRGRVRTALPFAGWLGVGGYLDRRMGPLRLRIAFAGALSWRTRCLRVGRRGSGAPGDSPGASGRAGRQGGRCASLSRCSQRQCPEVSRSAPRCTSALSTSPPRPPAWA